jgi:hypothetical protein
MICHIHSTLLRLSRSRATLKRDALVFRTDVSEVILLYGSRFRLYDFNEV